MKLSDATFWMAGRLATDCVEISNDPASLDKPGFWAVICTFEGEWICARFATVVSAPLAKSSWESISTTWHSSQSEDIYQENVIKIKEKIAAGDIYQVNLCRVLTADSDQSLQGLSNRLQSDNPAPLLLLFKLAKFRDCLRLTGVIFRKKWCNHQMHAN